MERKIRRNLFILIGLTVLLLIGMVLGWFFVLVRPQREALAALVIKKNARAAVAATVGDELKAQKQAQDRTKYSKGQLAFFQNRYRNFPYPKIGAAESETTPAEKYARLTLWRGLIYENYREYGEALIASLRHAESAVPPTPGSNPQKLTFTFPDIRVDTPPKAPEDIAIPTSGFIRPLSASGGGTLSVSVQGSFEQIQDFLSRINLEPILYVVGQIKLDGTSPNITATFTLTPYLLARGPGVPLGADNPLPPPPAPTVVAVATR